jgi:hypothetical protein
MEDKKTPCECPLAGYCNRHGITKTPHQHKLCQNHMGYFNMWEKGKGPGSHTQPATPALKKESCAFCGNGKCNGQCRVIAPPTVSCQFCGKEGCSGECRNENALPSLWQQTKNLAGSMKEAAKEGFQKSSEEEIKRRLEICHGCEYFIPESSRCSLCGCAMRLKTKLQSSHCPKDKW